MNSIQQSETKLLTMGRMLAFFLPLGLSAILVNISHLIIQSTLARAPSPELVIASFTVAMSIFGVTERPAVLLRQTCSALVRDQLSFRSMSKVAFYLIIGIVTLGLFIAYSPLGEWIFLYLLGVEKEMLVPIMKSYQILMFVSIFSGIRCLFQGVIIINLRTKWLTIGMVIRLAGMYLLSMYFIQTNQVHGAYIGAIIFLGGMAIEAAVAFFEGRSLIKKLPVKIKEHPYHTKKSIFQFYRPLLYSSFIAVIVGPAINAMLGKTSDIQLAIASYAIALSLTQLVTSFFSYIHQIVLNFYSIDKQKVYRFTILLSLIPALLVGLLAYTAIGPWFMQNVMGIQANLMEASIKALRVFMIMSLVFPWLDFCNGLIMLKGQTKSMVWSQAANVCVTLTTLFICISIAPGWNGAIGALAQSLGFAGEIIVLIYVLKTTSKNALKK